MSTKKVTRSSTRKIKSEKIDAPIETPVTDSSGIQTTISRYVKVGPGQYVPIDKINKDISVESEATVTENSDVTGSSETVVPETTDAPVIEVSETPVHVTSNSLEPEVTDSSVVAEEPESSLAIVEACSVSFSPPLNDTSVSQINNNMMEEMRIQIMNEMRDQRDQMMKEMKIERDQMMKEMMTEIKIERDQMMKEMKIERDQMMREMKIERENMIKYIREDLKNEIKHELLDMRDQNIEEVRQELAKEIQNEIKMELSQITIPKENSELKPQIQTLTDDISYLREKVESISSCVVELDNNEVPKDNDSHLYKSDSDMRGKNVKLYNDVQATKRRLNRLLGYLAACKPTDVLQSERIKKDIDESKKKLDSIYTNHFTDDAIKEWDERKLDINAWKI
jgi:hypothetical protein